MKPINRTARSQINGILFALPWILGFLVFTLYPLLQAFYYSLTKYNLLKEPKFIGLSNYIKIFTDDSLFLKVLYNTLYMVVFGVSISIVVTLLISLLLNDKRLKGTAGFRVMFFIPTLVPTIILCVLWMLIYNSGGSGGGLMNQMLALVGIKGPEWLGDQHWSKMALIIMRTWGAGNLIIIFLGGLQSISEELYEALSIDGGNFLQKTFYITLPMLKPIIVYNVITSIIVTMQNFNEAFIMTKGGPADSTYMYALYVYRNAFQYSNMGYASALSWIMLVITLALTLLALKASGWLNESE
ncbi:MAG TPA: sugar ABC transporter permease [Clostridiales bacterium]|nr:sugar ABC transporter permease [Clostridiales bacterium]HPV01281.1 sugar ABC transporter permease [Clostridiales bacterium]